MSVARSVVSRARRTLTEAVMLRPFTRSDSPTESSQRIWRVNAVGGGLRPNPSPDTRQAWILGPTRPALFGSAKLETVPRSSTTKSRAGRAGGGPVWLRLPEESAQLATPPRSPPQPSVSGSFLSMPIASDASSAPCLPAVESDGAGRRAGVRLSSKTSGSAPRSGDRAGEDVNPNPPA